MHAMPHGVHLESGVREAVKIQQDSISKVAKKIFYLHISLYISKVIHILIFPYFLILLCHQHLESNLNILVLHLK